MDSFGVKFMAKVSPAKIIKNDYAALLLTIGGPILLVISGFSAVFGFLPGIRGRGGQQVESTFAFAACFVALCLTVLFFYLLAKRVAKIKRIISEGPRVEATITDIGFVKDRGRIEFRYSYGGTEYRTGSAVMKNRQTSALASGAKLEVAIDPNQLNKAVIPSLFEDA
jgi:hypothetical protein